MTRIVLDAAELESASPNALRALAQTHRSAAGAGVDIVFADPHPAVATALTCGDLPETIDIYDTAHGAGTSDPDQLRTLWP